MAKVIDFEARAKERAAKEAAEQEAPETIEIPVLTPAGISTEGVITPDGQGALKVTLWESENVPLGVLFISEDLAANAGVLLARSAAGIAQASAEYRQRNARKLANQARQASSPIILPPGITDGIPQA